jgi:flavin reductase (DIM6/NTAB) family NADH-FMN oxidoreductase RutF
MRKWVTGVTIVTAQSNGFRHGMTVSSFSSVSLDPPTVSISLEQSSRTHDLVLDAGFFGLTFLSQDQQMISQRFAGAATENLDRFSDLDTMVLVTGAPFIISGLAFLDCQVDSAQAYGANTLIIGKVIAAKIGNSGNPLLYFDRQYRQLQD